jgi:8-oxo-dGTP pyrophosphatase MutT (NUDIX family)
MSSGEIVAVAAALTYGGRITGHRSGHWLAPRDEKHPGRRMPPIERRQGRLCIVAALVSYYGAAITFVAVHDGWSQVESHLRDHLLDAFGCAALYALVFRQFRQPEPRLQPTDQIWRLLTGWLDIGIQLAAIQLTLASAAIAAASVFSAGGSFQEVGFAGFLAALILQGFWTGVISGVSGADIVAAVIVHDSRVLLVRHRSQKKFIDWLLRVSGRSPWQFPCGKIEPDETVPQAAVREASGMAGVAVNAGHVIGEKLYVRTMRRVIYVACDLTKGINHVETRDGLTEVAWCDVGKFHKYYSDNMTIVEKYVDTTIKGGS